MKKLSPSIRRIPSLGTTLVLHCESKAPRRGAQEPRQGARDRPDNALALYNRGCVLQVNLARFAEALASYNEALVVDPGFVAALNNRGNVLRDLKRFGEALASYDTALAIKPDFAEGLNNYGNTLQDLKRFNEALATFDKILAINPDNAEALYNRGATLLHLKRFKEALESHEKALAIHPTHADALGGVANAALHLCDWLRTAKATEEIKTHVTALKSIIPPFVLLGYSGDASLQLQCARHYVQDRIPVRPRRLRDNASYRHDRIRIAYISSDFRKHPVAYQIVELLERHDRSRFDVLGISLGNDDRSDIRARLVKAFDQFHNVESKSDPAVAELLRGLEVDIAIDLNGHTQDARPGILAYRPAYVQVNFLGYPGTLGAEFIDYVIGDKVVLPFDQQPFFVERIVHLPDSFWVSDSKPKIRATPMRSAAGLPEHGFVFCCFNSHWKITPPLFEIWMRLLRRTEGSVLWLKGANVDVRHNLCAEAAARGINPERLVFAADMERADHLARHRLADLFLDTLPYGAHATASDVLRAGVPLVTCLGECCAGRVAASLLRAIGLPELVTESLEAYEALALKLAHDTSLRQSFRDKLTQNRSTHRLFDTDSFRQNIEAAYTRMWEIAERGRAPLGFSVDGALPSYGRGFGIKPDSAEAWNIHGNTLWELKRFEDALSSYDEALRINPDYAEALCNRGITLWDLKRLEEAFADFNRALAINPHYAEGWNNRGAALQSVERPEEALTSYDKALAIKPDYAEALYNRANVLQHLKRFEAALASYDKALAVKPDYAEAWNNRGGTLRDMKRIDDALASYDKALVLKPNYAEALYKRSNLKWSENRGYKSAILTWKGLSLSIRTMITRAVTYCICACIAEIGAILNRKQPLSTLACARASASRSHSYIWQFRNCRRICSCARKSSTTIYFHHPPRCGPKQNAAIRRFGWAICPANFANRRLAT